MKHIYVLLSEYDESSWEDIVIFLSKYEAINASKIYPNRRVEIFENIYNRYVPLYSYYKKGILHMKTIPSLDFSEEKSEITVNTVVHDDDDETPTSSSTTFFNIFYNCFSKT